MKWACWGPVGTSDPSSGVLWGRPWGAGAACSASGQEAGLPAEFSLYREFLCWSEVLCGMVCSTESQVWVPAFTSPRSPLCPQTCNASFATRDRLRSHLACHEDKVPCQVCGKYLRAAYMADHLKKHSEGPGNFCSICNRGNRPLFPHVGGRACAPPQAPLCTASPPAPRTERWAPHPQLAVCRPFLSHQLGELGVGAPRRSAGRDRGKRRFPGLGPMTHLLPRGQDGCAEPRKSVGIVRPPRGRRERDRPAESQAYE